MRSVPETIELDLSLRQSRTIYRTLAIVLFPIAVAGIFWLISAIDSLMQTITQGGFPNGLLSSILQIVIGLIFVGAEYAALVQSREATRRLAILRDSPEKTVRRMPAPFQSSLFGPYH